MYKRIINENEAHYAIGWSKYSDYNRVSASRSLPDLPGLIFFKEKKSDKAFLLFATWREGLRTSMQIMMDPILSKNRFLLNQFKDKRLEYKFCIVDSSPKDLQDIFAKLVRDYDAELNNAEGVSSSGRYKKITVYEKVVTDPMTNFEVPAFFKH